MDDRFTYENFAIDGVFTLLDPLFTIIAVFSILLLFAIRLFAPPAKVILFVSAFTIILSAQLLMINGIIVDELGLAGSSKTTILFGIAIVLQLAAIVFSYLKERKK